MKYYGVNMAGSIVIERIETKPAWSENVIGRILFEEDSQKYFLGAQSSDHGIDGWIPIGLYEDIVTTYEICIDETCTDEDCLSAYTLPTIYKGEYTSTLYAITDITELINAVECGEGIEDNAIKSRHLNTGIDTDDKINASDIPVIDDCEYFIGSTLEEVVGELFTRTAETIGLSTTSAFGTYLTLSASNVDEALVSIEYYISELCADQIDCELDPLTNPSTQDALDYLNTRINTYKLVDLSDVEDYQAGKPFLMSCGTSSIWVALIAEYVSADYRGSTVDVQTVIDDIHNRLVYLEDLDTYTNNGYPFTTVEGALDYIFANFFRPESGYYQTAIETPTNIESYDNVEEVLAYLLDKLWSPEVLNLDATEIDYYTETGKITVDAALDELYTFFTGFCYDECCQKAHEVPTPTLIGWESSNVKLVLEYILDAYYQNAHEVPTPTLREWEDSNVKLVLEYLLEEAGKVKDVTSDRLIYYVNQEGSGDESGKDESNRLPISELTGSFNYTAKTLLNFVLIQVIHHM